MLAERVVPDIQENRQGTAPVAPITLRLFGSFELGAGTEIKLASKKAQALLAYLALPAGQAHRRDKLAGLLWGNRGDEAARHSLRQTLSSIRKVLGSAGSELLATEGDTVALDGAAVDVDVARFEALVADGSPGALDEARELYRGDLFEGLNIPDPGFEEWLLAERRRLRELAVDAFVKLLDHQIETGDREAAVMTALRLLAIDPVQESVHRRLMRLYADLGRKDAALRQYKTCVEVLARELGVEPEPETRELHKDISRERAVRRAPESRSVAAPEPQPCAPAADPEPGAPPPVTPESVAPAPAAPPPEPPAPITAEPAAPPDALSPQLPAAEAERKHVTVLFADIKGSTELVADMDPETALERLDPAIQAMVDAVDRYEGTVSSMLGDGIMALFGAPTAHEDHAVRACYAALAMQEEVRKACDGDLAIRVGLHSGEVVVRSVDDGHSRHFDAVGPAVHLASRVEELMEPGRIGLTGDTYARVEGFVEVRARGQVTMKGLRDPITLYEVAGRTAARSRWEARAARALTTLVGREAELAKMGRALERARGGHGEMVAVVGDPGMGKSRLVHEFLGSGQTEGWTVLETGASAHESVATYLPVSNLLRSWLEVDERDTQAEIARKARDKIVGLDEALLSVLPPMHALLDLPIEDAAWRTLSPPQRRQRILDALKAIFVRESQRQPLILVVEDLHWIDRETQAVLDSLVDGLAGAPLLLLLTYRPEYRHNWASRSYFRQIWADPLSADSADTLLRSLLGDDPSLEPLRPVLVERTAGTPLFLEESVRALVETGALAGEPRAYRLVKQIDPFEMPSTIQAVLAARIDGLHPASKSLLQIAAVIGRDVPVALLQPVSGLVEDELRTILAELQRAELLYEVRLFPDLEYAFKHALTHDVAYQGVLRERRRSIHAQIVRIIEDRYQDRLGEQIERLALHAHAGELWEQAADYLYQAAIKAIQRSAHHVAIDLLKKGLEAIGKLAETPDRLKRELDYHKAMGVTMMAAKGWGAQEVSDAYAEARTLARRLGDDRELFVVMRGQGQFHMISGDLQTARALGDRCVALSKVLDDVGVHIETHHLFWSNSFFMGDYGNAMVHSDEGIALYDRAEHHPLTFVYSGHDPGVCCRCFSALILWQRGYPDRALARCREALALAEEVSHPLTLALANWALSYLHLFRREAAPARDWAENEISVCKEYLLPLLLSQGHFQRGWALAEQGEVADGIASMNRGLSGISATGAEMGLPFFIALLGDAYAKSGDVARGLAEIDRALATANQNGAHFQLPEMLRLKGDLLLRQTDPDATAAEQCLREALQVAQRQGAKLPELRAAHSLAQLWRRNGEAGRAYDLLALPFGWFTEGFDTPDLQDAKALLADLKPAVF